MLLLVYGNELVASVLGSLSLVRRKASENEDTFIDIQISSGHDIQLYTFIECSEEEYSFG